MCLLSSFFLLRFFFILLHSSSFFVHSSSSFFFVSSSSFLLLHSFFILLHSDEKIRHFLSFQSTTFLPCVVVGHKVANDLLAKGQEKPSQSQIRRFSAYVGHRSQISCFISRVVVSLVRSFFNSPCFLFLLLSSSFLFLLPSSFFLLPSFPGLSDIVKVTEGMSTSTLKKSGYDDKSDHYLR